MIVKSIKNKSVKIQQNNNIKYLKRLIFLNKNKYKK